MNLSEPEATLPEAIRGLESVARELRLAAQQPDKPKLERLQQVVASLGLTTTARPPHDSDEYLQDWQEYLADPQQQLHTRALRYLCWVVYG
jgi:hypothetical protein